MPRLNGHSDEPSFDCPVEVTLEAVRGRWVTLVLQDLMHGDKSYGALAQGLPKLSNKALTDVLAQLRERPNRGSGISVPSILWTHGSRTLPSSTAHRALSHGATSATFVLSRIERLTEA